MAGVVVRLMQRVWGPRAGLDGLGAHLEGRHGISVSKLTALDNRVMRVDRADGPPWVARVFPADRPVAAVDGDAAVLAYLADLGLPAERLAAAEPVSELSGQGVLLTRFVDGGDPGGGERTNRALVDLAGRLHALPPGPPATQREAGSLHLYTAEGGIRAELDTLAGLLDAVAGQVGSGEKALYEALVAEVAGAPDFADLPHALIHTDLVHTNVIDTPGELVPIDWTGTGRGPRVVSFAVPLFYGGLAPRRVEPRQRRRPRPGVPRSCPARTRRARPAGPGDSPPLPARRVHRARPRGHGRPPGPVTRRLARNPRPRRRHGRTRPPGASGPRLEASDGPSAGGAGW